MLPLGATSWQAMPARAGPCAGLQPCSHPAEKHRNHFTVWGGGERTRRKSCQLSSTVRCQPSPASFPLSAAGSPLQCCHWDPTNPTPAGLSLEGGQTLWLCSTEIAPQLFLPAEGHHGGAVSKLAAAQGCPPNIPSRAPLGPWSRGCIQGDASGEAAPAFPAPPPFVPLLDQATAPTREHPKARLPLCTISFLHRPLQSRSCKKEKMFHDELPFQDLPQRNKDP